MLEGSSNIECRIEILFVLILIVCVWVFCLYILPVYIACIYVHTCLPSAFGGQKRSDPVELEVVVNL